jgi:DedD protein
MENRNLNDIVIEDNDNSKKAQLKNILTLLALLFIILVISIVITKLILGNDSETNESISTNSSSSIIDTMNGSDASTAAAVIGTTAAIGTAATLATRSSDSSKTEGAVKSALIERNNSASKKIPLRDHRPKESTKRIKKHVTSTIKHTTRHKDTYVKKKRPTPTPKPAEDNEPTKGYYIQVGAFKDPSNAIKSVKANHLNYKTADIHDGELTRVLVGPYYSQKDAQDDLAKVKATISKSAYIMKIK